MAVYTLPELPYDYSALEPAIIGDIIELHHDKHHKLYVDGANTALEKIEAARGNDDPSVYMGLEKTLAFNLSGHILHSIYWENLSPDGGGKPEGELDAAITEFFGSFEGFQKQLKSVTTTVQGSGWGILAWDQVAQRLLIEQVYDHQGNVGLGNTPLLAFDAWEHAWYLQYKNVKADYVDALWNVVNWPDVQARLAAARA